ncbi:MAG: methionine--tRNA ligase [Bacillales bacterium]|nr:methionine--tRNA ligase [Bacillales bacterium]MDY5920643.1 methionine--tRNA ligase [Candidatus Enteromonas sp.]
MPDSKKKFYISTPIYYPSASPHLGHAYCTTMCDVIARGKRLRGYDVFFVTGLDEHGQKIEKNAEAKGVTPQAFVDEVAKTFTSLWNAMEISNDDFIRTTEERHVSTVQKIFSRMLKQDDIYLSSYTGWYCVHEETFWTETQVEVEGGEHLCPECHRPVEKASEDAYFYRCTKYSDFLTDFFDTHPSFITPESRKNEMINTFIKPGLQDLCVSRTSFTWGVPVLEDPKHVVYVWLDALTNYITSLGYLQEDDSKFQEFWQDENTEIVHVIGADITRFHTIYWPMFLHSLDLREPNRVFVHGLLMMKDGKMSKSKGNAISAYPLIERYGVDAVRYYLVSEVPFGENGIFTPEQFVMRINQDLANNLGNLLNRTVSMIGKYFQGVVPAFEKNVNPTDKELEDLTALTITRYETLVDDLKVTEAYAEIMNLVSRANKYIEENAPWALAKDETKEKELRSVMAHLAHVLFVAGMLLKPILVHKSDAIFDQLGLGNDERHYDLVSDVHLLDDKVVHKGEQLFPRLDAEKEIEAIKVMMAAPKEKAAA